MCVYVCVGDEIDIPIDIFTMHLLTPSIWNEWVSLFPMTTMIPILKDFKPILDLDLYGEHMPEGQKFTSTYLLGRLICEYIQYIYYKQRNKE